MDVNFMHGPLSFRNLNTENMKIYYLGLDAMSECNSTVTLMMIKLGKRKCI